MREMKDSGIEWIGEIPAGWNISPLKYDYSIVAGATPEGSNPEYWNGNVIWITPADYKTADVYVSGGSRTLSKKGYNSCGTTIIPAGNIVFSKRAPIGTVAINTIPLCTNQGCLGLVSRTNSGNNKYYYYVLSIYPEVFNLFGSGTTFKEISSNVFKNIPLPRPTSREQKIIADFLDSKCIIIDALSSDIQAQIDTLEQYKRSVISEAVTKGLDPNVPMKDSGIEWVGEIPANWTVTRFKYIAKIKSNLVSPYNYMDYPQISPDNIQKNSGKLLSCCTVEESGVISGNHLFFKGQILYSKIRPNLNKVIIAPFNGLCSADMYPIETISCTKFVLYLMLSNYFVEQVSVVIHDRVKMPKINQEELGEISIFVPEKQEQQAIADYLDAKCAEIDQTIAQKQEQLDILADYKKSLIYEYVTGKKEVPGS